MFFILSKIFRFLFSPVIWVAIPFIISLFVRKRQQKHLLMLSSGILFLVFTNTFIADEFMRVWEIPAKKHSEMKENYDVGILLSGMASWDAEFKRINFENSSDRILQTIELYNEGIINKIFISGGSGELRKPDFKEAKLLHDYLIRSGIPDKDVNYESVSRNTGENAIESSKILNPQESDSSFLLITSAYHMRRARACFVKNGFDDIVTYSTDRYTGDRKFHLEYMLVPRTDALLRWEILFKEVNGFLIYKIKGYA